MSEWYVYPGDDYRILLPNQKSVQTFSPKWDHTLKSIYLRLKLGGVQPKPAIAIYWAGSDHIPYGKALSVAKWWILPPFWPGQTVWVEFVMSDYLLRQDWYYAMIVRSDPAFLETPHEWSYHKDQATYPRGFRLTYDAFTDLWTHYYYDDHNFIEVGDPYPPPPPPPPPQWNWALEHYTIKPTQTQVIITAYTDRTCHLWLRWTTHPPWQHSKPIYRRGTYLRGDLRFCFVVFEDAEQEEEGDTLIHTFYCSNWDFCTIRHFYLHGTILGLDSVSVGPIISYHRSILFPVLLFAESWTYLSPPPPTPQLLTHEYWTFPSKPPPILQMLFQEPWTYYTIFGQLLFTEPWTYLSPPPPELEQLFTEPWTYYSPPPPSLQQLFTEPWTYLTPPPPIMQNLFTEEWTNE